MNLREFNIFTVFFDAVKRGKMKKEKIKNFAAHFTFLFIVFVVVAFTLQHSLSITGYQTLNASTSSEVLINSATVYSLKLQTALSSSAFANLVSSASLCLVINDPANYDSYRAVKTSSGWQVSQTTGLCNGVYGEDLIVQFNKLSSFVNLIANPSPKTIINGRGGASYYILPSKFIKSGGDVVCDANFKSKFCSALKTSATATQLIGGDMSCCLGTLTKEQKKLLQQHINTKGFTDETGIVTKQVPGSTKSTDLVSKIKNNIVFLGLFIVVGIFIGVGLFMFGKKKPPVIKKEDGANVNIFTSAMEISTQTQDPRLVQLQQYVSQTLAQGYTEEQVKQILLSQGWDQGTLDAVMNSARNQRPPAQ